jgi:hypothetical protein
MGCGCKKNKTQTTQTQVSSVNQTQTESQQNTSDTKIVDMIMEKLKTVEEEQKSTDTQ